MRRLVLVVLGVLPLVGCASLILRDGERGRNAARVVARVPLAVGTLGASEVFVARQKCWESGRIWWAGSCGGGPRDDVGVIVVVPLGRR